MITVLGLFFIPTSVFAYVVTLNSIPTNVEEGTTIEFSGTVVIPCSPYETVCIPDPAPDVVVYIVDQETDTDIVVTVTDIHGEFSKQWEAEYRDSNYLIFALAYTSDNIPHHSNQSYSLSVYQQPIEDNIQLILEQPFPSSTPRVGETLTFVGTLIAEDVYDKQIVLKVDGIIVSAYDTNENGEFVLSWTPQKEGEYTINAEYVAGQIHSTSYDVQVLPFAQLDVKIKTSQTKGIVPFTVTFNAIVAGGIEPYEYEWNVDNDIITQQSFTKKFVDAGEYDVTLTVIDSSSKSKTAKMIILASNPPPPPLGLKIIQKPDTVYEGSQVSFFADIKDTSKVKSYEWRIDGNIIGASEKITHEFANDSSYMVSLNVIDIDNKEHSTSQLVSVLNVPPKITSNLQDYEIESGEVLPLNVLYMDPGIEDNFTIEFFVDNQKIDTKFQSSPEFTTLFFDYPNPGFYDVKVVVTDNDGGKDERNFSIVIKERFPIEIVIGIIVAAGGGGGYGIKKYLDTRNEPQVKDLRIEIRVIRKGIER